MTQITETPGVQGGYPCIEGTRIPIRSIITAWRGAGDDLDVLYAYTDGIGLSRDDVAYAFAWYAAHPERVNEDIRRQEAAWEELDRQALDYGGPDATDEEQDEIVKLTRWPGRLPWQR